MSKLHSVLQRIAYLQGRRDEVPNQELAIELAEGKNRAGIRKIAENLHHEDPHIQTDCLKVLYEIGYRDATLVADYVDDFTRLLSSKNNRLVWGAMIGLSTVAKLNAKTIGAHLDEVLSATKRGSVITVDNGVSVLAAVAAREPRLRTEITDFLIRLNAGRRKFHNTRSGCSRAFNSHNCAGLVKVLKSHIRECNPSQFKRVQKVIALVSDSRSGIA